MAQEQLVVHGAREHNLKDITVRLPRNKLVCITGLRAPASRAWPSTRSTPRASAATSSRSRAYARQFLQMMEKPDVDSIDGLSPAISIDQKTTSPEPALDGRHRHRDLRLPAPALRAHRPAALPGLRAPDRGPDASTRSSTRCWRSPRARASPSTRRSCATARASTGTSSRSSAREGFTRVKVDGELHLLEEEIGLDKKFKHTIEVVVDRLVMKQDLRQRLAQSVETAAQLAEGLVAIDLVERRVAALLRELRVPRARRVAARAGAAHLLVQLAARRVPALHRPRRAAGDRPRPASCPTRRSRSARARSSRGRSGTRASTSR